MLVAQTTSLYHQLDQMGHEACLLIAQGGAEHSMTMSAALIWDALKFVDEAFEERNDKGS